jgi:hypothetical protein
MKPLTEKRFSILQASGMIAAVILSMAVVGYAVTVPNTFVNRTYVEYLQSRLIGSTDVLNLRIAK